MYFDCKANTESPETEVVFNLRSVWKKGAMKIFLRSVWPKELENFSLELSFFSWAELSIGIVTESGLSGLIESTFLIHSAIISSKWGIFGVSSDFA